MKVINENSGFDFPLYYVGILTILSFIFFFFLEKVNTEYLLLKFVPTRIKNQIINGIKNNNKEIKILNLRIRGISFIHALFSSIFAIIVLLTPTIIQDPYSGKPYFWLITGSYSMGYFLWDLTVIIRDWNKNNDSIVWLFHGSVSLISILVSYFIPEQPLIKILSFGILTESSTILLSIRYCYHIAGDSNSFSCKIVSLIFLLTFFITRNILLPYGFHTQMFYAYKISPNLRSRIRIYVFFPLGEMFNLMNIYWLYKVVINVFNPKDISETKKNKSNIDQVDQIQVPEAQDTILFDSNIDQNIKKKDE